MLKSGCFILRPLAAELLIRNSDQDLSRFRVNGVPVVQFPDHLLSKFNPNHAHNCPDYSEENCLILSWLEEAKLKVHFLAVMSIYQAKVVEAIFGVSA